MTQYSGKIIRKNAVVPTQQSASGVWTVTDAAAATRNNAWPVAGVPDPISRSCRFRSSASAYLSKTLTTPTNNKIWTWSSWVKKGTLTSDMYLVAANGTTAYEFIKLSNSSSDNFEYAYWNGSAYAYQIRSTLVLRDPSAWYHIVMQVDTTQATAANRVRMYVNNVEVTSFSISSYPSQNTNTQINSAIATRIGGGFASAYFDGYITEANFIDGQALTPSSFGTTDAFTGAWVPMAYAGTYGTNGFYLNFKDNTSTTTLGYDYSGNSNNWTANNISLTAGTTYDSMLDVPTPWIGYSATTDTTAVTRGNYCTINPLAPPNGVTISNANLNFACTDDSTPREVFCTFGTRTGKWYFEATKTNSCDRFYTGIVPSIYKPGEGISYGKLAFNTSTSSNITIMFAVDFGAGLYWTGSSGTWTGDPSAGTGGNSFTVGSNDWVALVGGYRETQPSAVGNINFGQRPFSYTVPTAFKAMCTTNLPEPTIKLGNAYFDVALHTGNGGTTNVTSLNFQPDLVWIKARSNAANHGIIDSVRGVAKQLSSSLTAAELNITDGMQSFNSNGFTVQNETDGYSLNTNGYTYADWCWKANGAAVSNTNGTLTSQVSANTTAGFSVVTYTGSGSAATVGHGLGVAPKMIIVKDRNRATDWSCLAMAANSGAGYLGWIRLNTTDAWSTTSLLWNNTAPTSSVFSIGTYDYVNYSGSNYVAYCFAEVAGYSKFGSYTGNGSTDGPFVYCGFRPRYVLIKRTDSTSDWTVWDTARNTYNTMNLALYPNLSNAEVNTSIVIDTLSNGFKVRNSNADTNASGGTYIYACFAENPFKYSNAR